MKRYCTKKMVERTKKATNICFEKALIKVLESYSIHNPVDILVIQNTLLYVRSGFKTNGITLSGIEFSIDALRNIQKEASDIYLENIKQLPSKILEEIILCHDHHKFKRAQNTLNIILQELANRGLLNDFS